MKKILLTLTAVAMSIGTAFAQLPAGSIAPDFTITDIDGNTHNLYEILDEGTPVVLDLFATWCGPCWSYAESGVMEEVHDLYGPEGTNEVFMMAIEADASTPASELTGGGSSLGDWTTLINYTLADAPDASIADAYELAYYPTIYLICPDRTVSEIGQLSSVAAYYDAISACPSIVEGLNASVFSYDSDLVTCGGGKIEPDVTIMNLGTEEVTACTINTVIDGAVVSSYEWTGSLETYATEQVTLAELPANTTEVSFVISMSGDLNADDDNLDVSISLAADAHASITVEFTTDGYPEESAWTIKDAQGNVVAENGSLTAATTLYTTYHSFEEGCYTFEVTDEYGDGLYGWGQVTDGSVVVTDADGTVILNVTGDFGASAEAAFEVTHGVGIEEVLENTLSVFPNPATKNATVELTLVESSDVVVEVVNTIGQRVFVQTSEMNAGLNTVELPVEALTTGMYYVNIKIANELVTEKLNIIK